MLFRSSETSNSTGRQKPPVESETEEETAFRSDRPGGSGLELDDNCTDRAKTAGRGIGLDRGRESEFVGPMPDSPKRIGRERLFVPIMFRKSEPGRVESRAEGRNAGSPRLRSSEAEAGEISAALRPGPEGARGAPGRPAVAGDLPPAGYIPLRFPGRCRPSGGSACREISALTKKGIDPRSKTPYIANRREGPRF